MSILIKFKRQKGSGDTDNTLVGALTEGTLSERGSHKIVHGEPAIFETSSSSKDQYLTVGSSESGGIDPIDAKYVKLQAPNIAQEADNIVYHDNNGLKTINQTYGTLDSYVVPLSSGGLGQQITSTDKILITNGANPINDSFTAQNIVKHGTVTGTFSSITYNTSGSSEETDIYRYSVTTSSLPSGWSLPKSVFNLQPNTDIYEIMQDNGIYSIYVENNNNTISLVVCGAKLPEITVSVLSMFNYIAYEVNDD